MQISQLPESNNFTSDDVIAIEIDGVTYKLTGSTLATALKTLGGYVSKTGDTMTGQLTITNNSYITKINPAVDVSTNPSSTQFYVGTELVDKNNKRSAVVECMQDTSGRNTLRLFAYGYDTNGNQKVENGLSVIANRDGTIDYALPNQANFRKAIGVMGEDIPLTSSSVEINNGVTTQVFSNTGFESYKFIDLYFEAQGGYTNAVRLYSNYTSRKYKLGFFLWNDTGNALRRVALTFTSAGRYMDGVSVRMAYGDTGTFNASSNFLHLVKAIGYAW